MNDFASLGFCLPEGLPNKEYAISDGVVSVVLDQSGGINLIEYQGPRRTDGPRRGAFYSNGVWRGEDFFPEPVLSFAVSDESGEHPVRFVNVALCPFGISSRFEAGHCEYESRIWIRGKVVIAEFFGDGSGRSSAAVRIREDFVNYHNDWSAWDEPRFDPDLNALRYNLRRNFTMGTEGSGPRTEHAHEACSMVGCFAEARCLRSNGVAELSARIPPDGGCRFAIVFAEDVRQAEWLFLEARRSHEAWRREQVAIYRQLAHHTPRLEAEGHPLLSEIIRTAPLFVRSTRIEKSASEVAFRASTRGYGIWNGWDGQWACRLADACADDDSSGRFLDFINATRGPNGAVTIRTDYDFGPVHDANYHTPPADRELGDGWTIFTDACAIVNLHEHFFRADDREQLARNYPGVARAMRTIHSNASPLGLVESCFGGADLGQQINRPQLSDPRDNRTLSSRFTGAEDLGVLFNACHLAADLAGAMRDDETVDLCAELAGRIEASFLDLFFDRDEGFLIDCVWPRDNPVNQNRTFKLLTLLSLSGYGELLVRCEWKRLAEFVRRRLAHPTLGIRNVPEDQPMHESGRWMTEHWLQNAGRELLKLARLAGDAELLELQVREFSRHFGRDKLVHEDLYNLEAPQFFDVAKSYVSTSWWQCMTASAWWHGIMEAVAGLRWERGLLEYLPGDGGADVRVSNLHRGKHCWTLQTVGRGRWVDSLVINGVARPGTHQLLPEGPAREQNAVIHKTNRPPEHPIIFSCGAGPAIVRSLSPNRLQAQLQTFGFTRLWFYSPREPCLLVDGEEVAVRWSEECREGTVALRTGGTITIEIRC